MVFQIVPDGQSLVEITAACPQSNNKSSEFTNDVLGAAKAAVNEVAVDIEDPVSLLSFAVDGVSYETTDVMQAIALFLDGNSKEDHTGAVNNKHNLKNDRYQITGGSCFTTYWQANGRH